METSIFHRYGDFKEIKDAGERWGNIPAWSEALEGGIGRFGLSILIILNQYHLLTRQGILKSVQTVHPDRWKQDRLSFMLKSLRKSGMIGMYGMEGRPEGMQALNVYALTPKAAGLLKGKGMEGEGIMKGAELVHKTGEALKWLSLNQYHTNLLYILGKDKEKAFYNTFAIDGQTVPSLVRYKFHPGKIRSFTFMNLFAFPAAGDSSEVEDLARRLIAMHAFLTEHPMYRPALAVIICENMHQASWLSWEFNKIRQMRPLCTMLYALDIITMRERMLSMFYTCDADEAGMVRNNILLG